MEPLSKEEIERIEYNIYAFIGSVPHETACEMRRLFYTARIGASFIAQTKGNKLQVQP